MNRVTTTYLSERVASITGLKRKDVSLVIKGLIAVIGEELKNGNRVMLKDFGTFTPVAKEARAVKIPAGKVVEVPARTIVKFKPSSVLLGKLNS